MSSSSNNANKHQKAGADSAGKPAAARPHWRHRDPTAAAVYVVHPTQFRNVVQQLTGAPPAASPPPATAAERSRHQGGSNGSGSSAAAATASNAAARHQQHGGGAGSSRQRTLGEMYQECMAWANNDDDEYDC